MSNIQEPTPGRSEIKGTFRSSSTYVDSTSNPVVHRSKFSPTGAGTVDIANESNIGLEEVASTSDNSQLLEDQIERSPYLVKRLLESKDKNLFNHVKFKLVKVQVEKLGKENPVILDVGCGLQVAKRYLKDLGLKFDYIGVDYESKFKPDHVVDLNHALDLTATLRKNPDVVLVLDVLEHLHEDIEELDNVIANLANSLPGNCTTVITLPQMYRLDRFKLSHLHYPEHKIRLKQKEWSDLLSKHFDITYSQGLGYISVLPYLVMASKRYKPDNRLGNFFNYLRGSFFEFPLFKPLDLMLSNTLGKIPALKHISNDILFVATPKR